MDRQTTRRMLVIGALIITVAAYAGTGIPLALAVALVCIAGLL